MGAQLGAYLFQSGSVGKSRARSPYSSSTWRRAAASCSSRHRTTTGYLTIAGAATGASSASPFARAHPTRLTFDIVCLTIDGDRPRAWVTFIRKGNCAWHALPRADGVVVDFDPCLFKARCVHAAGNIYWHICNSSCLLQLHPCTLDFSFMLVPTVLGDCFNKYHECSTYSTD